MANTIADMLAMETAEPDKTLTAIEVFGEKSQDADIAKEEMMKLAMEIAIGSTPIGGSIRGGKVAKSILSQLNKLGRKYLDNVKSSRRFKDIADFEAYNKLSKSRIQNQKVLDKYGIADPDKAEFVDTITDLLTRSKN